MFASWGLRVQGADLSTEMIQWCQQQHGQSPVLSGMQRSFTQKAEEPSDVVICTGNSLALAEDMSVIEQAIAAMASSARHALLLQCGESAGPAGRSGCLGQDDVRATLARRAPAAQGHPSMRRHWLR